VRARLHGYSYQQLQQLHAFCLEAAYLVARCVSSGPASPRTPSTWSATLLRPHPAKLPQLVLLSLSSRSSPPQRARQAQPSPLPWSSQNLWSSNSSCCRRRLMQQHLTLTLQTPPRCMASAGGASGMQSSRSSTGWHNSATGGWCLA